MRQPLSKVETAKRYEAFAQLLADAAEKCPADESINFSEIAGKSHITQSVSSALKYFNLYVNGNFAPNILGLFQARDFKAAGRLISRTCHGYNLARRNELKSTGKRKRQRAKFSTVPEPSASGVPDIFSSIEQRQGLNKAEVDRMIADAVDKAEAAIWKFVTFCTEKGIHVTPDLYKEMKNLFS